MASRSLERVSGRYSSSLKAGITTLGNMADIRFQVLQNGELHCECAKGLLGLA